MALHPKIRFARFRRGACHGSAVPPSIEGIHINLPLKKGIEKYLFQNIIRG
jgi:hypothetical protein